MADVGIAITLSSRMTVPMNVTGLSSPASMQGLEYAECPPNDAVIDNFASMQQHEPCLKKQSHVAQEIVIILVQIITFDDEDTLWREHTSEAGDVFSYRNTDPDMYGEGKDYVEFSVVMSMERIKITTHERQFFT
ncbi:hypothetical protein Mfla_2649 [Methylobacillus flagellatus KT]|uniref:Uncharacterized protein n=1 Tax=Methylobacillus flagellatus (strain ATCC 51484 / DSM 6875 / VKM B-1610 / KT) TaxID=265072 RepID=Q1GXX5_METFK|nr:hypothetical protein [Methylobacillus flagellatus]ABE50912.1 hypothetical protein Mfla_2649 [Methylobacillus flagellatus KT]